MNVSTSQNLVPDNQTLDRIAHLSKVGAALNTTLNDTYYQTSFYVALESLNKFREDMDRLQLAADVRDGIESLIVFLHKKLEENAKNQLN